MYAVDQLHFSFSLSELQQNWLLEWASNSFLLDFLQLHVHEFPQQI